MLQIESRDVSIYLASALLNPGGFIAWLIIGLLAGAIAGMLVRGRGYGCLMDVVVGVIGSFIGGIVIGFFLPGSTFGFIGTLIVATLGAVILLAFIRVLSPKRP
jgi:uncharacterized membrane protein YeaQ/YmgE (transglycosylase-associated protein family)